MMEDGQRKRVEVHNDYEFYLTVMRMKKPVTILPMEGSGSAVTLSEMECRALIVPPGADRQCQCCSDAPFPPAYPFVIEESGE